MKSWLVSEYAAVIFEEEKGVVAYAMYREQPEEIYLRQLFVVRNCRRQESAAMRSRSCAPKSGRPANG